MTPAESAYYTTLKPFAKSFATGLPILTYHKLGPRPAGVKIKGLYVSRSLFERQLAELNAAGFTSPGYGKALESPGAGRTVALSFDDGFLNVLKFGLEPLARHRFRAIEFLVADRLGGFNEWETEKGEAREALMDFAHVKEWLSAGHEIGSHTLTHPFLTQIKPEQARDEIVSSKKKLEDLFGIPIRHFCHPYGDWNPAIRDLVIEAGYESACTTTPGVNGPAQSRFELMRLTARHRTLSIRPLKARLAKLVKGG
jgi:peptidoglycan/xylan/chitin deacetylase (PgdA/CDA1 family)